MDLRQDPRVRAAFRAVACFGETALSVEIVDVSSNGVAVTSDRPLPLGSAVRVSWFNGDERPAEIDAVLVRVQKLSNTTWLWGLAFRALEPRVDHSPPALSQGASP